MGSSDVDYYFTEAGTVDGDNLTNSTANMCEVPGSTALSSRPFVALVVVLYGVILVGSVAGNGLVVYTITRNRAMRTVTNLLLLNLALGDLLLTLVCIPFVALPVLILQHWPFGLLLCQLVSCVQGIGVLVSAYTLIAVSGDRYRALRWPLRARLDVRGVLRLMLCIWLLATLTAAPIGVVSKLSQPTDWHQACGRFMCREEWPHENNRYGYTLTLLWLQYIFPVCFLLVTYTLIVRLVWNHPQPGEEYRQREVRAERSRNKVIFMMIAVVTAFLICWMPLNVLLLVAEHQPAIEQWSGLPYLYLFCHWFAMSHACCNPVIYSWLNARFRAGFCLGLSKMPVIGKWIPQRTILDAAALVGGVSRRPSLRPDLATRRRPAASRPTSLSTACSVESPCRRTPLATDSVFRFPPPQQQQPTSALRRTRSAASSTRPWTRSARFGVEQPRRTPSEDDDTDSDIGALLTPPARPLLTRQCSVPAPTQPTHHKDIEEEVVGDLAEADQDWWFAARNHRKSSRCSTFAPSPEPTFEMQKKDPDSPQPGPSSAPQGTPLGNSSRAEASVSPNVRRTARRLTVAERGGHQRSRTHDPYLLHARNSSTSRSPSPRPSPLTVRRNALSFIALGEEVQTDAGGTVDADTENAVVRFIRRVAGGEDNNTTLETPQTLPPESPSPRLHRATSRRPAICEETASGLQGQLQEVFQEVA